MTKLFEQAKDAASRLHQHSRGNLAQTLDELENLREHVNDLINAVREDIGRAETLARKNPQ